MKWEKISTRINTTPKQKQENIYIFIRHTKHYIRSKLTSRKIIEKKYQKLYKLKEKMYRKTEPQLYIHRHTEERYRAYILRFY